MRRVAQLLGKHESVIEHMLMDRAKAILGIRNLLHPFGKGVQPRLAASRSEWYTFLGATALSRKAEY